MSFTRKEEKLVHDPYFRVIRETDQFVEIQSLNTGHCWNVFKNMFESTMKVILYHKHKQTDAYYHEHRTCRTVAEAVDQIKSHDTYVLKQFEEVKKKKADSPQKAERNLKVYQTSGYHYTPIPTIMLKGKWLEEYGFLAGDSYQVLCEDGKLTLIKI